MTTPGQSWVTIEDIVESLDSVSIIRSTKDFVPQELIELVNSDKQKCVTEAVLTPTIGMGRGALLTQIKKRNPAVHYGLLKREIREVVPYGFSNELIEYHWANDRKREKTATKNHKLPNNYSFIPVKEREEFQPNEMFGNNLDFEIQGNCDKDLQRKPITFRQKDSTWRRSSMFYISSKRDDKINHCPLNGLAVLNELENQYVKVDIDSFGLVDSNKEEGHESIEKGIDKCKTVKNVSQAAQLGIQRKSRNALFNGLEKKALAIKEKESSQIVLKIPADFL